MSRPGTNQGASLGRATSARGQLVPPFAHQRAGGNEEAGPGALRSEGGGEQGQAEGRGTVSLEARV